MGPVWGVARREPNWTTHLTSKVRPMSAKRGVGTLALLGGGEWCPGCREFDTELLAASGGQEVVVLPTAAAFEHPERVADRAAAYFTDLGAKARPLMVLHRTEAEDPKIAATVRKARFVYL